MEISNNRLLSAEADVFFDGRKHRESSFLNDNVVETVLRYAALRSRTGDLGTVAPIKAESRSGMLFINNDWNKLATDCDCELLIVAHTSMRPPKITLEGWVSLDKPPYPVALLFAKAGETHIFINEQLRKAVIIVKDVVLPSFRKLLASCLLRILPWRFHDDELDKRLMTAINKGDEAAFRSVIDSVCSDVDLRGAALQRILAGWEDELRKAKIVNTQKALEKIQGELAYLQEDIAQKLDEYDKVNVELQDAMFAQKRGNGDVLRFFQRHRQLSIVDTGDVVELDGRYLDYAITETIEYYNEEQFLRMFNNADSPFNSRAISDETRGICYAIFKEHLGVVRAEAVFRLTNLSSLRPRMNGRSENTASTCIIHPHIGHYGCLGGNETPINRYMKDGQWDLAIEQTIAAAKNLNMGDIAVLSSFLVDLKNASTSIKCIIADNGVEMTPHEFYEYVEEAHKKAS